MKEKKTYLLQGARFMANIEGYSPKQPFFEADPHPFYKGSPHPFLVMITIDPEKENQGVIFSNTGNHPLHNIYVDSSDISFETRSRSGENIIFYSLCRVDDSWTGYRWTEEFKEKGIIKCLVSSIEENLFDKPETLNGLPFIGNIKDWAQHYKWHLEGPNKEIPYNPKTGKSIRRCSNCFYRNYDGAKDSDCHCGENGDLAKISFNIPKDQFMPYQINGKEVGNFCPHWTDPAAD